MPRTMVLTKDELIGSFQNEVRILLHLIGKLDRNRLDYRPTPKQRSILELLRYLSVSGPGLGRVVKAGAFDPAAWQASLEGVKSASFDETISAIEKQSEDYAEMLSGLSEADFRSQIETFGKMSRRGAFIINAGLCGAAAYRMQLFLYLKACGGEELNTMNLWAGVDGPWQG